MADFTQLGPYEIVELVRRGRSAETYLARHARMKTRQVLLRVLHDDVANDEAFMREFLAEARAAARLQHDCVASVIDLESESRPVYTVLEYIEGLDLGALRESFGPMPPEVAAAILVEVCRGLDYAHEASVLHRRLRPRLIKVTANGRVKILGFGIKEQQGLIQPTVNIADVEHEELFRSPEQVREQPEARASDLYSLGVIFFELLTGHMPYPSFAQHVAADSHRTPPRVRDHAPLVPAPLATVIERMLADRPGDRPATAAVVRREAEAVLEAESGASGAALVQSYLGNPAGYSAESRRRGIKRLLDNAEKLANGSAADRATALSEVELLLTTEPGQPAALALAQKLRAANVQPAAAKAPAIDPMATMVMPPPGADPFATQVMPPAAPPSSPIDPMATQVMPPRGRANIDPMATQVMEPSTPPPAKPKPKKDKPAPASPPPPPPVAPSPASSKSFPLWMVAVGAVVVIGVVAFVMWNGGRRPAPEPAAPATPEPAAPVAAGTASVFVSSQPTGARVTLLDTDVTMVTDTIFTEVAPGSHRWRIEKDGFLPRDTTLDVEAGARAQLMVALAPSAVPVATCSLYVSVTPPNAYVTVDNVAAGGGPGVFHTMVSKGRHQIAASAEGHITWSGPVFIKVSDAPRHLGIKLLTPADTISHPAPAPVEEAPAPAAGPVVSMKVAVKPASDVLVDKVRVASGVTTTTLELAPGNHKVRIENPGYVAVEREFSVKANKKLKDYSVDLTAGSSGVFVSGPQNGLPIYLDDQSTGKLTPERIVVRAGSHTISVRRKDGSVAASRQVIVDPSKSENAPVAF